MTAIHQFIIKQKLKNISPRRKLFTVCRKMNTGLFPNRKWMPIKTWFKIRVTKCRKQCFLMRSLISPDERIASPRKKTLVYYCCYLFGHRVQLCRQADLVGVEANFEARVQHR